MLTLATPSLDLAESFEAFRDACVAAGDDEWAGRTALAHADVPAFTSLLGLRAAGQDVPEGWVPETTYWIVDDDHTVVGTLDLRHPLNDRARQFGGNVGYLTHPGYRNVGVATFALREALRILGDIGLSQALLTCRDDNHASIRVIERCGGIRIENSTVEGPMRRRYVIALS